MDTFPRTSLLWMGLLSTMIAGCSLKPPGRMDVYLGPAAGMQQGSRARPSISPDSPLKAGLLVINDTTAKGSAPPLSEKALADLTKQVQEQILNDVPVTVTKVLADATITPQDAPQQLIRLAKDQGVGYLLLVIVSSTEDEAPSEFSLLNGSESVPGVTVENFSLVEMALLDGTTGAVLVRAQGRELAVLKRLVTPMGSNEYPIIGHPEERGLLRPKERDAYDELRRFAGSEALTQAVRHFQEVWSRLIPA